MKGAAIALERDAPLCILGLFDDELPEALQARHPTGADGFPLYFIGDSQADVLGRTVSQMADRSGPDGGRVLLRDWVKDGVLTYTTEEEAFDEGGVSRRAVIATATLTPKMKGWVHTREDGTPVVCHGTAKVANLVKFTEPVETRRGKLVRVDYRWEIDEVAPWMVDTGADKGMRESEPEGGVPASVGLVATPEGWIPVLR